MRWFEKIEATRKPDFIIGEDPNDPYMLRWWLIPRNKFFNIYLHKFLHSDTDEALHDHPWANASYLLKGTYTEWTNADDGILTSRVAKEGSIKFRFPSTPHRVELHNGPCWSLFFTGPVVREWGFHCDKGFKKWKKFLSDRKFSGHGCD